MTGRGSNLGHGSQEHEFIALNSAQCLQKIFEIHLEAHHTLKGKRLGTTKDTGK